MTMSNPTQHPRQFAIGDIHGDIDALDSLLEHIRPTKHDTVVFLGDYIDRGQDSCAVVERLINLKRHSPAQIITLLGNHEQMLLDSTIGDNDNDKAYWQSQWAHNGAKETIMSYKAHGFSKIPDHHFDFYQSLSLYHENEKFIFTHATPSPDKALTEQTRENLLWQRPSSKIMTNGYTHKSGKTLVCGHTPQHTFPTCCKKMLLIDTGCGKGGTLTALNVRKMECFTVHKDKQVTEFILPFDNLRLEPPAQLVDTGELPEPPKSKSAMTR